MSIVVTGASGHLGRLIVTELLAAGADPATVVAGARRPEAVADLGVQTAVVDYAKPETLAAAFAGADTVMLVSSSEVGQRVPQHQAVIDAAVAAGVARIVYTSAPHADTSELVVAPEHRATEELLRASGLAWTILRNNWYTENYVGSVQAASATGEVIGAAGDGRVASATRADYAAAAAAVLLGEGHEGKVYELTGDTAWSFPELAAVIGELIGREVVYRDLPGEEYVAALVAAGVPEGGAQFLAASDAGIKAGLLADATADLRTLIGRPTTPLADALRAAIA
ncbi:SDR family oxidoreductase [Cellulomonas citrea]|uniref:SDR family oxidoreductase n=1 Tax=Cellulomonas citrea TaxID=1909423 RepID=UPI00135B6E55|nr:SDR family oxidoreductase [Cellulomonas citrea]